MILSETTGMDAKKMKNIEQASNWLCINAKVGSIPTSGGIKPVLIVELTNDAGEIAIKFFNAKLTAKGNLSVDRNSDFAKLYRLTTGNNPIPRFTRCNQLMGHLIGYQFIADTDQAISKKHENYLRVTNIKPLNPITGDTWCLTGHMIKNVRVKSNKLAINKQRNGNKLAISWQFVGNGDSTLGHNERGLEGSFNPIQHPPSKIGTFNILHSLRYKENEKYLNYSPPDNPVPESSISVNKQTYLH